MSAQLVYYLTGRAIADLLPAVLPELVAGRMAPRAQAPGGDYYRWPDSAAMDRLKQRGHSVFSWRDRVAVLTGCHDAFEPGFREIHRVAWASGRAGG